MLSLCLYRVKAGSEDAFEALLRKHWPTLRAAGLATGTPSRIYRGTGDEGDGPFYAELLEWSDAKASERAHELPEVMAVWEPMGALCESRNGAPAMEFPSVEALGLHA